MNKLIITGNLGGDAEEKTQNNDQSKIYWVINIATTEKWKNQQGDPQSETTWHKCMLRGNYQNLVPYLRKGQQVLIEGTQKHYKYELQGVMHEGKPVKMTMPFVTVSKIELLGGKPQEPAQTQQIMHPQNATATAIDPEEELPF